MVQQSGGGGGGGGGDGGDGGGGVAATTAVVVTMILTRLIKNIQLCKCSFILSKMRAIYCSLCNTVEFIP
jgi:hypothetical protein